KSLIYPSLVNTRLSDHISLDRFDMAQLAIFAFEFALTKTLMELGITPDALIGYSFGEYSAACISGVVSLKDAIKVITERGTIISGLPNGVMLSVPLTKDELTGSLTDGVELAIDNGESCVVAGTADAINAFEQRMKETRILCMRLSSQHPIHSSQMRAAHSKFEETLVTIESQNPKIPLVSNVTGTWVEDEMLSPHYWLTHLSNTVQFTDGIRTILDLPNPIIIEIGPGAEITSMLHKFVCNREITMHNLRQIRMHRNREP